MKKRLVVALLGSAAVLAGPQAIAAADKGEGSIENAIKQARSLGYTEIREVEADDDHWEIQGEKNDGKDYELRLDKKTGEVLKDEED
ncbi:MULTISPECIES: PepSY domain-containing protein [Pseudomonas]|uniref:PepSY domain-containing protein n=1 Tax=Pseudomonas TaxID=286 RepID=UPI0013A7A211|nr:PepSY domain-containing protein [Pseudomonas sp. OIL-1]QIB51533.1 PepSY domain-containing protein [Pseudomonas sp. OIL-1]